MNCLHCGATISNGLALCELCQRKGAACLEFLPIYVRNLARWKPGRAGARPVPGSREPVSIGAGSDDMVIRALDEVNNALTTWARLLVKDRPHFPRPLTLADAVLTMELPQELAEDLTDDQAMVALWLSIGFEKHLTSIATLDWCGEFISELSAHEATLRYLTERVAPGWYAGACRRCDQATYVIPGFTWVTCQPCGATTYARDHLETILTEARGWVARPKAMAETIVALIDTEQSIDRLYARIRKWESLGWLEGVRRTDRDGDPVGPKRYRLGDVLDLVLGNADAATRPMRMTSA